MTQRKCVKRREAEAPCHPGEAAGKAKRKRGFEDGN